MYKNIQILDCTLRDGGQGLEDNVNNHINDAYFDSADIENISRKLAASDVDIIELGCMELSSKSKRGFAIEQCVEDISRRKPNYHKDGQLFAALYTGPDTPLNEIPEWNPNLVDAIRVIIRYSEMQRSLDFCAALAEKGYKVFVQPMLTMRYTDNEIAQLIIAANNMNAYALYFVDSYGYMQNEDVDRLYKAYLDVLSPDIRIGFHSHNNMNLAFSNVLRFLSIVGDRKVIVDTTCMGMGQGAGNMQTELLLGYLITEYGAKYNYDQILDICEILEKYTSTPLWGYSVTRMLPAIYKAAYKYSVSLRNYYGMSYREINGVLSLMPEDLKHRYTKDNVKELLVRTGHSDIIWKRKKQ